MMICKTCKKNFSTWLKYWVHQYDYHPVKY